MNPKEMEDYRKMIAHHCQQIMGDVFKEMESIDIMCQRSESSYQYLSRYRQELRTKLNRYMYDQWWGREQ